MRTPRGAFLTRRRVWFLLVAAALLILLTLAYSIFIAWQLTHVKRAKLPTSPAFWGMRYSSVRFPSAVDHLRLHGWWIPAAHPAALTVVFSHGYGSNRADIGVPGLLMMRAVHAMGANILTFDYRAEGRSPGNLISVGEFEVRDLLGAVQAVQRTFAPGDRVAVVGYSMGATIALMAAERDPSIAAVVADSPFADLVPYLQRHLSVWTHLPSIPFNWIILAVAPPFTGVNPWKVDPVRHTAAIGRRPVLLIAGAADKTVPADNSRRLFAALWRTDHEASLWIVPGSHHVEAFQLRPLEYLRRLYGILHRVDPALRRPKDYGL